MTPGVGGAGPGPAGIRPLNNPPMPRPMPPLPISGMADGGSIGDQLGTLNDIATMFGSGQYNNPKGVGAYTSMPFWQSLRAGVLKGRHPMMTESTDQGYAQGGQDPHVVGGLSGSSGGQADDVPARLSHGEYVIDADVVSALGDGNNSAGADKLDQFREAVRTHKRGAPSDKIPPKAKDLGYYMPKKR